jgi:hypothetical protein
MSHPHKKQTNLPEINIISPQDKETKMNSVSLSQDEVK